MRIFYIANVRFPTERAHGIQIANTCSALANRGAEVTLVVPARPGQVDINPFQFYGLPKNFSVTYLSCGGKIFTGKGNLSFAIRSFLFIPSVFFKYFRRFHSEDIFYGREEVLCGCVSLFSKKVFWETHMGSDNFFSKMLMRRAAGIIGITSGLTDFYASKNVPKEKLIVAADAVDVKKFSDIIDTKSVLRKKLNLPDKAFIVTYSGSLGLYSWKGWDVFLEAISHVGEQNARFLVVGGTQKEIEDIRKKYTDSRIIFAGRVAPEDVRQYLKASDALVIPNKSGDLISERYTSPMKLFEYMAAEKPIIASDLPSIREVITEDDAFFFRPDDVKGLAAAVDNVMRDTMLASVKAKKVYVAVKEYGWDNRAEKIFNFINSNGKR